MNNDNIYKAGLAEVDVTPPVGIKLSGFAVLTEPSVGIELPLKATVLYLEDPSRTPIFLLSVEWVGFYDKAPLVRKKISQATGVPEYHIVLIGTHTHAGPCVRKLDELVKGPCDQQYFQDAVQKMVDASLSAMAESEAVHLSFASRDFSLAMNRRQQDPSGIAKWGPNPDAWVDEKLSVLSFRRVKDGSLKGIFFSYTSHPTSRITLEIGGDYVGYTFQRLKEHFPGVPTGFLQGFAGDVKPFFVSEDWKMFLQVGSEEINQVAIRMADSIKDLVESPKNIQIEGLLSVRSDQIHLPLVRPSRELHQHFKKSAIPVSKVWVEHFPTDEEAPPPDPVPFEIQSISLGSSLAMIFLAGEISVGYSKKIRELCKGRFRAVMPIGYANEMIGYVATAEQIPEGGYEVWYAHQFHQRPGFFDERTEALILKCVAKQMHCETQEVT